MCKKFLTSIVLVLIMVSCGKSSPFENRMHESLQTSLSWRNDTTGIWETAGWWNSANVLTAVIRYGAVTGDPSVLPIIDDVFEKSRHYSLGPDSTGTVRYADNFINDYYDDEAWWALAWIESYKLTGDRKYLNMAEVIFKDMTTGWDESCGGGIYWKKHPWVYKNAIANNLFTLTAIRLYKQTQKSEYLDWFNKNVNWLLQSGMVNTDIFQIEDGTTNDCKPNRNSHYTYNQGVAIAVLTEKYLISKDKYFLELAENIAKATIQKRLVTEDGILREMNTGVAKGNDGVQFKGIFIRHLAFLYEVSKNEIYKDFIIKNATSIISKDYDPTTKSFGCYWYGPFQKQTTGGNSSALECVIEAYKLTK